MRRVLIVSPHFPPINAPDMQRARLALPHLRELGWEPVVLAVTPESVEGAVIDPLLEQTYPRDIRVVRVRGIHPRFTRRFGFGSLWLRCGRSIRQAGDELLTRERFDLVFFTTTQFDTFSLSVGWRRRFGVPYVLDYQDPWVNDYYRKTRTRPPGGAFKFWCSQLSARLREPAVIRDASGIVSVSSSYGPDLLARYPKLDANRIQHLPFGAATDDLDIARSHQPPAPLISFEDGNIHFVYTGRCGPDMRIALTLLFRAFRFHTETHPETAAKMRFHFIGTDYAPPPLGRYWALPIAEAEGVENHVSEHCYRVPYFDALHYLIRADALIAVGSNDPTYSASKIFPYLLARRPMITLVHEQSIMLKLSRDHGVSTSYGFGPALADDTRLSEMARVIEQEWFAGGGFLRTPTGNETALVAHTAKGMTQRLASLFDRIIAPQP